MEIHGPSVCPKRKKGALKHEGILVGAFFFVLSRYQLHAIAGDAEYYMAGSRRRRPAARRKVALGELLRPRLCRFLQMLPETFLSALQKFSEEFVLTRI